MMVLTTQSSADENESSQGRQLPVSKKLSKAIGSVSRSRFQKPRPNLLSAKRGDSNVSSSTPKTSETAVKSNSSEKVVLNANVTSQNVENKDVALLVKDKTLNEQGVSKPDLLSLSGEKVENVKEVCTTDSNTTEKVQSVKEVCTTNSNSIEKVQSVKEACTTDSDSIRTTQEVPSVISTKSNENKTPEEVPSVIPTNSNKNKTSQEAPSVISAKSNENETPREVPSVISANLNKNKTPSEVPTVISTKSNKNKSSQEIATDISTISNKESTQSSPLLEKTTGATNTPSTISDKSSKYPHLTSILSKKRSEPKREVQQKKRRKFKKGEAAPERSKMTMADLIYWNPANAEKPQKSSTVVEEAPISSVEIEEELVDDNVEENAIQESVPKLVISEDGQINIDQSSLFVSRNLPQPTVTEVRKDDTTYSSFRKRPLTKHWDAKATRKFYEALILVGSDFSLMETIFPNRTRRELKQKFKREEKYNIDLINRVLYEPRTFDEDTLKNFMVEVADCDSGNTLDDSEVSVKEKKSRKKRKTTKENDEVEANSISELNDSISDLNESFPELDDPIAELNDSIAELNDTISERTAEESINTKDQSKKKRKKVKKSPKTNDDEEDEVSINKNINCYSITERQGSKRKRSSKKLPDDFVSIDLIEEAEFDDIVDTQEKSIEYAENILDEINQELSQSESVNSIEVIAIEDAISNEGNYDHANSVDRQPIMFIGTDDDEEECVTVDIKNVDAVSNLTLLTNVMAYEVVTSQAPVTKKKRKVNPSTLRKTQQDLVPSHLSSANYTHYTPV